jgi:hypothetical protein
LQDSSATYQLLAVLSNRSGSAQAPDCKSTSAHRRCKYSL